MRKTNEESGEAVGTQAPRQAAEFPDLRQGLTVEIHGGDSRWRKEELVGSHPSAVRNEARIRAPEGSASAGDWPKVASETPVSSLPPL